MSSEPIGLHSSYIIFHRAQREHDRLQVSYNQWLAQREKSKQAIVKQITSIKESGLDPKKTTNKLSKLNAQLSVFEEEEAEVADAELLQNFPNARPCHRPAYRKLAFETALKQTEEKKNIAEEVYNAAVAAKGLPVPAAAAVESPEADAQDASLPTLPLSPEAASSSGGSKPMNAFKKFDAFLTRLERGKGMTKTFSGDRQGPANGKWALRASTFEPGRAKPPSS